MSDPIHRKEKTDMTPSFFNTPDSERDSLRLGAEPATESDKAAEAAPTEAFAEVSTEASAEATAEPAGEGNAAPASDPEAVVPAPEAPSPRPATPPAPTDDTVVHGFSSAHPLAVGKLNNDNDMVMSAERFVWVQQRLAVLRRRDKARRSEPTIGELRILDALERARDTTGERDAAGEILTGDATIATAWRAMMDTHDMLLRSLDTRMDRERPKPCVLSDMAALWERYLRRSGAVPHADEEIALLPSPTMEAEAVAAGYRLVARLEGDGAETRLLLVRRGGDTAGATETAGDFLVLVRNASIRKMETLIAAEREKEKPDLGDVRALSRCSVLCGVLDICGGADIYAGRLAACKDGRLPVAALCGRRTDIADGQADFLLRVPVKRVYTLSASLRALGLAAVVLGQVRSNDHMVIHGRNRGNTQDVPMADLPSGLLREAATIRMHRVRLDSGEGAAITLLPPEPAAGLEVATAVADMAAADAGYATAQAAMEAARSSLPGEKAGAPELRATALLRFPAAAMDAAVGVLCGLYAAAAAWEMPLEDILISRVAEGDGLHLEVSVWGPAAASEPPDTKEDHDDEQDI